MKGGYDICPRLNAHIERDRERRKEGRREFSINASAQRHATFTCCICVIDH
jgi:hypothetical protein